MPEEEQELGRKGVKRVQRLLEATMRFNLPYNAYHHPERVRLKLLTGRVETYDLNGDHLDELGQATTRIFIESKNVEGAADQGSEFNQFLAQAYSATRSGTEDLGRDPKYEFMWATTSPWKGEGFRQVASSESVSKAVQAHLDDQIIPASHQVDDALVRAVSQRVWVWVISNRQEDMVLGKRMRSWLRQRVEEESS